MNAERQSGGVAGQAAGERDPLEIAFDLGADIAGDVERRDRSELPGTIRVSFGIYNTKEEVDQLIIMVKKIVAGDYHPFYMVDRESGSYNPRGFKFNFEESFKL